MNAVPDDITDLLEAFALHGGTEARRRGYRIADCDLLLAARDEIRRLREDNDTRVAYERVGLLAPDGSGFTLLRAGYQDQLQRDGWKPVYVRRAT